MIIHHNNATNLIYSDYSNQLINEAIQCLEKRMKRISLSLSSTKEVSDYLRLQLADEKNEVFAVLFLANRYGLIQFEKLFQGTINEATIYPRQVVAARKSMKQSTVIDYTRALNQVCPDWLKKPLIKITKDLIAKRHAKHGENHSKARANLSMRVLRAIFNFAMHQYQTEDGTAIIVKNPVKFLSHARSWYRIGRRQTVVKSHQLTNWYQGLMQLTEPYPFEQAGLWQDYFLLILFTGMRRQEAASLTWNNIDLQAKTFSLPDTKNSEMHMLPMSDFLFDLFQRRKSSSYDQYVFPSLSRSGHITDPRKALLNVRELSGVNFTIHDLRRTFITIAESLDISAYALKRLLNHKMNHDVTSGYLIIDAERLRKPMQQITNYLLKCMGVVEKTVVQLRRENA